METQNILYDSETLERIFNVYKRCAICKCVKMLDGDYHKANTSECKVCRRLVNQKYYQKKKAVNNRTSE